VKDDSSSEACWQPNLSARTQHPEFRPGVPSEEFSETEPMASLPSSESSQTRPLTSKLWSEPKIRHRTGASSAKQLFSKRMCPRSGARFGTDHVLEFDEVERTSARSTRDACCTQCQCQESAQPRSPASSPPTSALSKVAKLFSTAAIRRKIDTARLGRSYASPRRGKSPHPPHVDSVGPSAQHSRPQALQACAGSAASPGQFPVR
jgi:hypothetical protein